MIRAQYDVAVLKKSQDSAKQLGQQAVQLIEASAEAPKLAETGNVGTRLNIMG